MSDTRGNITAHRTQVFRQTHQRRRIPSGAAELLVVAVARDKITANRTQAFSHTHNDVLSRPLDRLTTQ